MILEYIHWLWELNIYDRRMYDSLRTLNHLFSSSFTNHPSHLFTQVNVYCCHYSLDSIYLNSFKYKHLVNIHLLRWFPSTYIQFWKLFEPVCVCNLLFSILRVIPLCENNSVYTLLCIDYGNLSHFSFCHMINKVVVSIDSLLITCICVPFPLCRSL